MIFVSSVFYSEKLGGARSIFTHEAGIAFIIYFRIYVEYDRGLIPVLISLSAVSKGAAFQSRLLYHLVEQCYVGL